MSPSLWDAPVTQRDNKRGPLQVATCALCGLELPLGLMVPDGGEACADLRWYCKDAQSCTQRWTVRGSAPEPEPEEPEPAGQLISTPDDA